MVWVLALVAAGLLAFLIFMWLDYQKRAAVLKIRQEQLRQRLETHLQAAAGAREKTEEVKVRVEELGKDTAGLQERLLLFRGSRSKSTEEEEQGQRHPTRHRLQ